MSSIHRALLVSRDDEGRGVGTPCATIAWLGNHGMITDAFALALTEEATEMIQSLTSELVDVELREGVLKDIRSVPGAPKTGQAWMMKQNGKGSPVREVLGWVIGSGTREPFVVHAPFNRKDAPVVTAFSEWNKEFSEMRLAFPPSPEVERRLPFQGRGRDEQGWRARAGECLAALQGPHLHGRRGCPALRVA